MASTNHYPTDTKDTRAFAAFAIDETARARFNEGNGVTVAQVLDEKALLFDAFGEPMPMNARAGDAKFCVWANVVTRERNGSYPDNALAKALRAVSGSKKLEVRPTSKTTTDTLLALAEACRPFLLAAGAKPAVPAIAQAPIVVKAEAPVASKVNAKA